MGGDLMIISNSQERISKYTKILHYCSSKYLFFSDYDLAFYRIVSSKLSLLIIDNIDENKDLPKFVRDLLQIEGLKDLVIIIITKEQGCKQGLAALQAGADDYISLPLVTTELAVRVKAHLNKINKNNDFVFNRMEIDLSTFFPIEDRILIKKSLIYIKNNLSTLRKVEDLAIYIGKSERYINKVFTDCLGETVFEYIRNSRINRAKELILTTRILVVDIAEEVGYSSAENFSTAFKAAVGVSPTEYRKQARTN